MEGWQASLKVDPVPTLLASDNAALVSLVRRDLVGEEAHPRCVAGVPLVCRGHLPWSTRSWLLDDVFLPFLVYGPALGAGFPLAARIQ